MSEVILKSNPLSRGKRRGKHVMMDHLRQQILSGAVQADEFLLPERQLAEQYGVSSRVVRECLAGLEAEGLISRQQGRGTIVRPLPREAMSPRTSKNVAMIILQRMRDASTLEFFDALQQVFQRGGYGTTIYVSDDDPEKEVAIVKQLVEERVPGIILFTAHEASSFEHIKAAQEAGIKVTLFDHYFPNLETNFAGIDDRLGAYEATSHLLQMNCEEMIFVGPSLDWSTHTLRQQGFEEAMQKWPVPVKSSVLKVPLFSGMKTHLDDHLPAMLPPAGRKVGVVCWSDQAALHTIDLLRARGWSVPENAAVIGFSDDAEAARAPVPLTTMKIPREEIARLSAYILLDQMRDPSLSPQHLKVLPHLVIRSSCGCYPVRS